MFIRQRKFWLGAISCFLLVSLLFGITEISLRFISLGTSQLSFLLNYWETQSFSSEVDPITGAIRHKPNLVFTALNRDRHFVTIRTDSFGFRNSAEYNDAPILALGDSFTYGDGVEETERWTNLLSKLEGKRIYVVAAGITGPMQQLVMLRQTLGKPSPKTKLIIWTVFSGNDIDDSCRYLKTIHSHNFEQKLPGLSGWARYLMSRLYLPRFIVLIARMMPAYSDGDSKAIQLNISDTKMNFFPATRLDKSSDKFRPCYEGLTQAIFSFAKEIKPFDTRLIVVYAPNKEESYFSLLRSRGVSPEQVTNFDESLGRDLSQNDIEFINLLPEFEAAASSGSVLYFPTDGHWNIHGNQLAANIIHRYLSGHSKKVK